MQKLYCAVLFVSFCSFIMAQKDTTKVLDYRDLPEVVITGTGTEHYIKDAPVQTEVISDKALRRFSGKSIEEILGTLSASFSFSKSDMGAGIQMNGFSNGYIVILVDGKRLTGDIGGQNDLNTINLANIEKIEIVRGATSSLYGSDAIAGVINFITKKNKDHFSFVNTSRIGCYNNILQNNTAAFKSKKWNFVTAFNYKHTDGWKNTSQEWYRHQLYDNSKTKTVNSSSDFKISQLIAYNPNKKLSLSTDLSYYQRYTNRPSSFPKWYLNDHFYKSISSSLDVAYFLTEKDKLSFSINYGKYNYYYDYTQREYTDFFDENNVRIVHYPGDRVLQSSQQRVLSQLKGVFYLPKGHIVNTGVESNFEMLDSPYRLSIDGYAKSHTFSTYLQDEINLYSNVILTSGVRWVYHDKFGDILTPKIAVLYKFNNFNIRGSYSSGFKAPTVKELYYSFIGTIMTHQKAYYGNENLKPQKSNYFSLGGEYHTDNFKSSIHFYYNKLRDMIALEVVPTSPEDKMLEVEETMRYNNLAKARSYGMDFTFDYKINKEFNVGGGYSYVDAKAQDTEDENFLIYKPINGTSYHNATFRSSWEQKWSGYQFVLSLFGRYQSKRFYIADGDTKPYQIWRLNTSHYYPFSKKWNLDVDAGVDNIFNYIDKTPFGRNSATSTPGRTYYINLKFSFREKYKPTKIQNDIDTNMILE